MPELASSGDSLVSAQQVCQHGKVSKDTDAVLATVFLLACVRSFNFFISTRLDTVTIDRFTEFENGISFKRRELARQSRRI
jgi:hypothetical protein